MAELRYSEAASASVSKARGCRAMPLDRAVASVAGHRKPTCREYIEIAAGKKESPLPTLRVGTGPIPPTLATFFPLTCGSPPTPTLYYLAYCQREKFHAAASALVIVVRARHRAIGNDLGYESSVASVAAPGRRTTMRQERLQVAD
jgi:hypothetical protein